MELRPLKSSRLLQKPKHPTFCLLISGDYLPLALPRPNPDPHQYPDQEPDNNPQPPLILAVTQDAAESCHSAWSSFLIIFFSINSYLICTSIHKGNEAEKEINEPMMIQNLVNEKILCNCIQEKHHYIHLSVRHERLGDCNNTLILCQETSVCDKDRWVDKQRDRLRVEKDDPAAATKGKQKDHYQETNHRQLQRNEHLLATTKNNNNKKNRTNIKRINTKSSCESMRTFTTSNNEKQNKRTKKQHQYKQKTPANQ